MDYFESILTAITTVGFPIVLCLIFIWFIKYLIDKHSNELSDLNNRHDAEYKELTKAINNNTLVMQKLITKLGGDD